MAVVGGRFCEDLPDFGAIFMSNRSTKNESFQRELFGLPYYFNKFVKYVKAGMLLFLFEYEKRNLYGVFEAIEDGGTNIIPNAFRSSGKSFPAQVHFRVVWKCHPLHESLFRDAIKDNYYSSYKFTFGLSKEQVQRLVCLFDSNRAGVQKSLVFKKPCDPINSETPVEQADGILTSEDEFTVQISKNSSGSQLIQLQGGFESKKISNDSLLELEDFIPLSDSEDCEPLNTGILVQQTYQKCLTTVPILPFIGNHHSSLEHHQIVKSLYCDTPQKRKSVFSRLQIDGQAVPQDQGEKLQDSSMNEQESEKKSEFPRSVNKIMKKLELVHGMWKEKDTSPVKKTSVFSRLGSFPEVNNASSPEDGKNISVRIKVKQTSSPVNVKRTTHFLDIKQVDKKRKLMKAAPKRI